MFTALSGPLSLSLTLLDACFRALETGLALLALGLVIALALSPFRQPRSRVSGALRP